MVGYGGSLYLPFASLKLTKQQISVKTTMVRDSNKRKMKGLATVSKICTYVLIMYRNHVYSRNSAVCNVLGNT